MHEHKFETQLIDEAATGSGGRLPYEVLMQQRGELLRQSYLPSADKAANPILFFSQSRQLLHANPAALKDLARLTIDAAVGLRLGEIFGCEHKMTAKPGEVYQCQDCNSMPSLRTALAGRHSTETRYLIMHPEDRPTRAIFRVSSVPMSAGDLHLAMMIFQKMEETEAL
jgi:hypothetical protein